jgi:hypothetical protein
MYIYIYWSRTCPQLHFASAQVPLGRVETTTKGWHLSRHHE